MSFFREEAAMDKELEQYAHDCIRLAGMTDDPAIREPLLRMAREWMEIARAEQQQAPGHLHAKAEISNQRPHRVGR
jgi:hypothetical protein